MAPLAWLAYYALQNQSVLVYLWLADWVLSLSVSVSCVHYYSPNAITHHLQATLYCQHRCCRHHIGVAVYS